MLLRHWQSTQREEKTGDDILLNTGTLSRKRYQNDTQESNFPRSVFQLMTVTRMKDAQPVLKQCIIGSLWTRSYGHLPQCSSWLPGRPTMFSYICSKWLLYFFSSYSSFRPLKAWGVWDWTCGHWQGGRLGNASISKGGSGEWGFLPCERGCTGSQRLTAFEPPRQQYHCSQVSVHLNYIGRQRTTK